MTTPESPDLGSGSPLAQIEGLTAGHAPLCPVIDGGRDCTCAPESTEGADHA